jgi:CRP-like cAMP-binding protein
MPQGRSGRKVQRPNREQKLAVLLASALFQAMRPDELEDILGLATDRHYARGTLIFQKGEAGSNLMAVLRGRVRIGVVSAAGKEVTLNIINPGEIFGEIALLDGKPRSADATAIEETHLLVVERKLFLPFLRNNDDLYLRMLAVVCGRLRVTSLALEEIALLDLDARLARLLSKLAADYGRPQDGGVRIGIKVSQGDLATQVASTRESVNKQIRRWEEDGVLRREAGYYVVLQPTELQSFVG